ncbi:MAG: NrfD/PsrC family molybdoenzyme membrane anchor subunit [Carbonactinosporaceae bacterium]
MNRHRSTGPSAEPGHDGHGRSYYGRPIIKPPTWKSPDVPAYLFLGGMSGASSVIAALARATRRPALARGGQVAAALGATASVGALIHDLGRPERFLHMLRVAKPTSPLNAGSWLLAAYGTLAGAAGASSVTGLFPRLGRATGLGAALLGPPMTTYTAVLLADTAVPAWHEAHRELPFVFCASAMQSGGAVGLLVAPPEQARPAGAAALAGTALGLAAERLMVSRLGFVGEPYRRGRARRLMRASQLCSLAGGVGAAIGRRSRVASALSGGVLLAGSACLRLAVFEAGMASARDPRYTVVPQRARRSATGSADR